VDLSQLRIWRAEPLSLAYCKSRDLLIPVDSLTLSILDFYQSQDGFDKREIVSILSGLGVSQDDLHQALLNAERLLNPEVSISSKPSVSPELKRKANLPNGEFCTMCLTFQDMPFSLVVPSGDLRDKLSLQLQPLLSQFSQSLNCLPSRQIYVVEDKNSQKYALQTPDVILVEGLSFDQLAGAICAHVFREYRESLDYLFAFHGAAVHFAGVNWLMPAESGAGKSTLVNALIDAGGYCFSDDALLLDKSFQPMATHMPICVKKGSWGLTGLDLCPDQVMRRMDGREFIYRWLEQKSDPGIKNAPVVILSPQFDAKQYQVSLSSLSLVERVDRFTQHGYQKSSKEVYQAIINFVDWIEDKEAVQVGYSSCKDAISWMSSYASKFKDEALDSLFPNTKLESPFSAVVGL